MGVAVAEAALDRGAQVTLIAGTVSVGLPDRATIINVGSTAQMRAALLVATVTADPDGRASFDALVMAAAVADFRPAHVAETKLVRGEHLTLELEPTPDLLAEVGRIVRGEDSTGDIARQAHTPRPILVGFAAETGSLERAADKLRRKGVDLLVANDVAEPGSGFGTETNRVTIFKAGRAAGRLAAAHQARGRRSPARPGRRPAGRPRRRTPDFRADFRASRLEDRPARSPGRDRASDAGDRTMSATVEPTRRLTVSDITKLYADGQRIPMLTAYDYPTAQLLDEAGIPLILVGDSLGEVMLGYDSTVRVTMAEMLHHTRAVVRGTERALVIGDMPFLSYSTPDEALENAGRFLQDGGAQAVKIEGGVRSARIVETLVRAGIPTMGHIGWTPQAKHGMGGKVRVQGKSRDQARALLHDALAIQEAGAFGMVLELVPEALAAAITAAPARPHDRHRGGRRLQRPGPRRHGPARSRLIRAPPRAPVRPAPGHDPRGCEGVRRGRRGRHVPWARARDEDGRGGPRRGPRPGRGRPAERLGGTGRRDPARPRPLSVRGAPGRRGRTAGPGAR